MTWDPYCTPPEVTPIARLGQLRKHQAVIHTSTNLVTPFLTSVISRELVYPKCYTLYICMYVYMYMYMYKIILLKLTGPWDTAAKNAESRKTLRYERLALDLEAGLEVLNMPM